MKITMEFDEKKLIPMICSLDAQQAQLFLDAMKSTETSVEIVPMLEEIINRNTTGTYTRESRIAG